jgi:hypothetical protein
MVMRLGLLRHCNWQEHQSCYTKTPQAVLCLHLVHYLTGTEMLAKEVSKV